MFTDDTIFLLEKTRRIIKMSKEYEMGKVETPSKKNNKALKIVLTIVAVIVVIAIAFGIAFAVAPRDVMKMFMSDQTFTKYTISQSMDIVKKPVELLSEFSQAKHKNRFDASANISLTPAATESMASDKMMSSLLTYINTLKIKGTQTRDGFLSQSEISVFDNDGRLIEATVLSDDAVAALTGVKSIKNKIGDSDELASGVYFKINSISSDWLTNSKESLTPGDLSAILNSISTIEKHEDKVEKGIKGAMKEFLNVCFTDNIKGIQSKQELKVENTVVTGDKLTFTLTPDRLSLAMCAAIDVAKEDKNLYDVFKLMYDKAVKTDPQIITKLNLKNITMDKAGYKNYLDLMSTKISKATKDADWKEAEISLYVSRDNDIVGASIKITPMSSSGSEAVITYAKPFEKGRENFVLSAKADEVTFVAQIAPKSEASGTTKISFTGEDGYSFNMTGTYKGTDYEDGMIYGQVSQEYTRVYKDEKDTQRKDSGTITIKSDKTTNGNDIKAVIDSKETGVITLNYSTSKLKFQKITLPPEDTVLDLSSTSDEDKAKMSEFTTKAMQYVFTDLATSHPDLSGIIKQAIFGALRGEEKTDVAAAMNSFGSLINGINQNGGDSGFSEMSGIKDITGLPDISGFAGALKQQ